MDRLEEQLRDDAALVRAELSPSLDARIRASLEAAAAARVPASQARRPRVSLWWASSLTGIAAALAVVALLQWQPAQHTPPSLPTVAGPAGAPPVMPMLHAEAAVLTAPLEEELDALEADLEKARQAVSRDLGLDL